MTTPNHLSILGAIYVPNHLSILGIIHTSISIFAILAGLYALYLSGRIDPKNGPGKWYVWLTILTCLTSLPIMKLGHPTAGHYLAIIIFILLPIGIYARQLRIFGKLADYVQVIIMSTTLFLSFIPTIVESLTRLPISQPIANGPADPLLQKALSGLMVVYVIGVIYQIIKLRASRKTSAIAG
ncbi:MAG TPA: hypothetical protein VK671_07830 [Mucilaginibacter sp.]|jgi:hypothetical protein|nr:hypothetical protein [Mucilaginibacter sp.]